MNVRNLAIALSVMSALAACDQKYAGLDAVLTDAVGHDPVGAKPQALLANAASSSSSEQALNVTPPTAAITIPEPSSSSVSSSSSSSVYIAPLTEECQPGESQFRVWTCDSTGHRSYI